MGATRKSTTSDELHAKRQAYYAANKTKLLARAKQTYAENRPVMLAAMQRGRDAARVQRLIQKTKEFYASLNKGIPGQGGRVARTRAYVQEYKANKPCLDCGQTFAHYVMDFDHVRGTKAKDVSTLVAKGVSVHKLVLEIAKCDLVCANCHRVRTFTRL